MKKFRYQEQDERKVKAWLRFFQQQQEAVAWFNQNPQLTPIPPAGAWIYSGISQTGTLASSTAVTALSVGTSFLAVGQVVTGTGIVNNPPTTIAAIGSGTAITLSQAATASGAQTLTFQGVPGLQSPAFSNFQFFGVPSPAAAALDIPGHPWAIPESQTINAGATFIPAPGGIALFLMGSSTTTAATIDCQFSAGAWTAVYTGTVGSAAYSNPIDAFDGGNIRVNNRGSAALAFTIYRWRGQNPIY